MKWEEQAKENEKRVVEISFYRRRPISASQSRRDAPVEESSRVLDVEGVPMTARGRLESTSGAPSGGMVLGQHVGVVGGSGAGARSKSIGRPTSAPVYKGRPTSASRPPSAGRTRGGPLGGVPGGYTGAVSRAGVAALASELEHQDLMEGDSSTEEVPYSDA